MIQETAIKTNEKNSSKRRQTRKEAEKTSDLTKTKKSDSNAEENNGWDSHMPAFLMRPLN